MQMPWNSEAVRGAPGKIVVYLSPQHPAPAVIPPELQDHVTADEWNTRIPQIAKLGARYYKPMFERIWMFLALASTLIVPIAVYDPIYRAISKTNGSPADHFYTARAISFAVFIGILLVFWGPILIWKGIGKMQMNRLLASYTKYDQMMKRHAAFIPQWHATTPNLFTSQVILSVTVPPRPTMAPSPYGPDAALPPYIAPAADAGGAYYYPYAAAQQGQDGIPRMSVVGRPPTNNSQGFGLGYGRAAPAMPALDEHKEMRDAVEVKV